MERYTVVLIWILILGVILLSVPTQCKSMTENFTDYYGYYKKYCPSCQWRGKSCGSCTNCGKCITSTGYSQCSPGDSQGPYFRTDCAVWEYGDPQTYYAGANVYPIVKMRNIYPYTKWNMWRNSKRGKRLN